MSKCPKCGKKFGSIQALNDHFRSIHPNEKFVAPKQPSSARTLIVIIVIVILVVGGLVGYLIYVQSTQKSHNQSSFALLVLVSPCLQSLPEPNWDQFFDLDYHRNRSGCDETSRDYRFSSDGQWQARGSLHWRRFLPVLRRRKVGIDHSAF